jgi:hypothetical protein
MNAGMLGGGVEIGMRRYGTNRSNLSRHALSR